MAINEQGQGEVPIEQSTNFEARVYSIESFASDVIQTMQEILRGDIYFSGPDIKLDGISLIFEAIKINDVDLSRAMDMVDAGQTEKKDFFRALDEEIRIHKINILKGLIWRFEVLLRDYTGDREFDCSSERVEAILEAENFRLPSSIGKLFGVKVKEVIEKPEEGKVTFKVAPEEFENVNQMQKALAEKGERKENKKNHNDEGGR